MLNRKYINTYYTKKGSVLLKLTFRLDENYKVIFYHIDNIAKGLKLAELMLMEIHDSKYVMDQLEYFASKNEEYREILNEFWVVENGRRQYLVSVAAFELMVYDENLDVWELSFKPEDNPYDTETFK